MGCDEREEIRCFKGHHGPVWSVALSPDGKTLATGSNDYTAQLWDVATGKEINRLKGHGAADSSITITPEGPGPANHLRNILARLWKVATGTNKSLRWPGNRVCDPDRRQRSPKNLQELARLAGLYTFIISTFGRRVCQAVILSQC
ncbi:WD40 repeat domain-containing protein [Mesorhizobium escarrei]|uniref:WD40 repeat domain-containing protein n=1 Tax=Mesorhizobium escarrei TaxID=666018 RepID=A0ABM9E0W1_9HYPH|nr:hypothetical protein MES5069_350011 [Mesorhizobium escarrei]